MSRITIVGSGASGVHFALSALEKGHAVTMLDVGFQGPGKVRPDETFTGLKCLLKDPARYFLGEEFESVVPPDYSKEIYGFPPNKQFIFKAPEGFQAAADGFEPLFSFARGGLAEAWTGGAYPFDDRDLEAYPISYADLAPYYGLVAKRIGIMGDRDGLARFFPVHDHLLPPLEFDEHSRQLVDTYRQKGEALTARTGVYFGRSRVAVLSRDQDGRGACDYSGRCLWGCPSDALYVPSLTLTRCLSFPEFTYLPGQRVTHFSWDENQKISRVTAKGTDDGRVTEYPVDHLVLAAGTLSSALIYLESIYRQKGEQVRLPGLMDNRQILVPFINLKMIGRPYNASTYQYHQLAVGLMSEDGRDYVHGQVTSLKTALIQPVLQTMPLDWKTATFMGRNLHAALGVININLSDTRRDDNHVGLNVFSDGNVGLDIHYRPAADEKRRMSFAMKQIKRFALGMGLIVPPGQAHERPMGASVHYSGTLPMSVEPKPHTVSADCRSHDFENLYFVDGTTFPALPAKNLTLTLMANAARVADRNF